MTDRPGQTIVVLTGSGISAESGVPTFRDGGGIWDQVKLEDVATPEAFDADPAYVHDFYNARRRQVPTVQPNAAHRALARLERAWPGEVLVITQNIDDLHQRAGQHNLLPMHGEILKARCLDTGEVVSWHGDITPETPSPVTQRPGALRPHVVWFGEVPFQLDAAFAALARADLFVAIGTSGSVQPAAGFVETTPAYSVEINLQAGPATPLFDEAIFERASQAVPAFVDALLSGVRTIPETK